MFYVRIIYAMNSLDRYSERGIAINQLSLSLRPQVIGIADRQAESMYLNSHGKKGKNRRRKEHDFIVGMSSDQ
jgi:hypothetical protein